MKRDEKKTKPAPLLRSSRNLDPQVRVLGGPPKVDATQDVPEFDYSTYTQMLGLNGIPVERPSDVAPAWEQALAADGPTVIDARVDPAFAAAPPHLTNEQAVNFTRSLLSGIRKLAPW